MATDLAIVADHPVQYKAPLYQLIAKAEDINLTVFYCSDKGTASDPEYKDTHNWDLPLLNGYEHKFLTNHTPLPNSNFFSNINPSLFTQINDKFDSLLIHIGYYSLSAVFALLSGVLSDIQILLHGTGHHKHNPPLHIRTAKQAYIRPFLTGVDIVLADCTANRRYYEEFGAENIEIMPAAVDNDRFQKARTRITPEERDLLRSELNIPDENLIVLFVGKLIPRKRPKDLLRAFDFLSEPVNATLVFVGDGPIESQLQSFCDQKDIENVVFAGFQPQHKLPLFYEISDLFVLPSQFDTSGKVINEAMNFELPIIASDHVGIAEDLIKDNGRIYRTGDVGALCDSIEELLDNETRRREMGARSLELIEDWNYHTDIEVLRRVLPK